jgi:hypothetical protein
MAPPASPARFIPEIHRRNSMRNLLLSLAGATMVLLAPSFATAAPALSHADAAPVAVQKPIEQVRLVNRCRVVKVWRNGPHGRRLVPVRRCRQVQVR